MRYFLVIVRNEDVNREIRKLDINGIGFCEIEW